MVVTAVKSLAAVIHSVALKLGEFHACHIHLANLMYDCSFQRPVDTSHTKRNNFNKEHNFIAL